VNDFKTETEEKRRMYNELLAKDKKGVGEIAENNAKIQKLMVSSQSYSRGNRTASFAPNFVHRHICALHYWVDKIDPIWNLKFNFAK
jgi:hypothetical protein